MATAAVTGTITDSINESSIVAGGKTLIITLTGDTWIASERVIARLDTATSSQSSSFSYAVSAGTDRYLIVGLVEEGTLPVATVTYGGQAMTQIAQAYADAGVNAATLYGLNEAGIAAASGTTIAVSGNKASFSVHAASYQGVSQSSPVADTATNYTNAPTPNPVEATVNGYKGTVVIGFATCGNTTTGTWGEGYSEKTDQQAAAGSCTGSYADGIVVPTEDVRVASCTWASQNRAAIIAVRLNHD